MLTFGRTVGSESYTYTCLDSDVLLSASIESNIINIRNGSLAVHTHELIRDSIEEKSTKSLTPGESPAMT